MMLRLMGDFETTTIKDECRVWASCLMNIETQEVLQLVNNIDETMCYLSELCKLDKIELYYHNLKFDGEFILSWLLLNGFKYDEKLETEKTFKTLITDTGLFYQIEIRFHKQKRFKRVVVRDSLKIIPLKVETMAKAFGLQVLKGSINYTEFRPKNHTITNEEREYIINDCSIVSQCLLEMFKQGLEKMTMASNALNDFKKRIGGNSKFRGLFPLLNEKDDNFIRASYKGGYTYVNPKYQNKWIDKEGCTYDVNSLYPSVMHSDSGCLLPYGMPIYFKGDYTPNEVYPLYIIRFKCKFKLKKGYVPTVQMKGNCRFAGRETEYLTNSGTERVELIMTNIDYETFKEHYKVTRFEVIDGYMFKGKLGIFDEYLNYWIGQKIKADKEGNKGLRQISKLMCNSLYGKFATNNVNDLKIPVIDNEGVVKHTSKVTLMTEGFEDMYLYEDRERELNYTAMASFITAYARRVTHRAIQQNYDYFCYADTDSIHLCTQKANNIEIHSDKLGAWKHESNWSSAKFIRAKTYIEEIKGIINEEGCFKATLGDWSTTELEVKCAGMPENVKKCITKDNFNIGFTTEGLEEKYQKLIPKRVVGGVVLVPTYFSIN